jgi:tetratricopeptide (TPR) repeat protein
MNSIQRELVSRPIFIVIVSEAAARSEWVKNEVEYALLLRMQDHERILLPVVIGDIDPALITPMLSVYQWIRASGPLAETIAKVVTAVGISTAAGISGKIPIGGATPEAARQRQAQESETRVANLEAQGNLLREQGDYEQALALYESAITDSPNAATAWALKGAVLADLGRTEEAVDAFAKSTALDPTKAQVWQAQANLLRNLRRDEEAVAACEHALALDPRQVSLWVLKGYALWALGRFTEAAVSYSGALELDPTSMGDMAKSVRSIIRRLVDVK